MKVRRCFVALNWFQSLFYFGGLVEVDPDLRQEDAVYKSATVCRRSFVALNGFRVYLWWFSWAWTLTFVRETLYTNRQPTVPLRRSELDSKSIALWWFELGWILTSFKKTRYINQQLCVKVRRSFVSLNWFQSLFYFGSLVEVDPDLRQEDGV
ncbi:hypothetical protein PCIT_b0396 [Pseudoalteromonas citrea]|uniref:Uncharacterized protein n=2 Tax=Pseudoalteromonas citrea TaxID=43655 RepID=A0AAD4FPV4_9GAMM|nr:hypothetical protein [Pseudoalteromonas citrea]KAF7764402.1 hypothetical protein PCIT_b0396 [Pseudoalteromonas citrea]